MRVVETSFACWGTREGGLRVQLKPQQRWNSPRLTVATDRCGL